MSALINPVTGAIVASGIQTSVKVGKASQKFLTDELGYDFVGLGIKISFFFIVAYLINKTFEAIIFGGNVLATFMALFGIKSPSHIPESLVNFFTDGINGFRFWDIVKILATFLVILETFNYIENRKLRGLKPSPLTLGVFAVIIIGISLVTFPELIQRLKEKNMMAGASSIVNETEDDRMRDFR